jgi:hypothetical protein
MEKMDSIIYYFLLDNGFSVLYDIEAYDYGYYDEGSEGLKVILNIYKNNYIINFGAVSMHNKVLNVKNSCVFVIYNNIVTLQSCTKYQNKTVALTEKK